MGLSELRMSVKTRTDYNETEVIDNNTNDTSAFLPLQSDYKK